MVTSTTTTTTMSKRAQKARRIRKPGDEDSPSSTDSDTGRPVTRSQEGRAVRRPILRSRAVRVTRRQGGDAPETKETTDHQDQEVSLQPPVGNHDDEDKKSKHDEISHVEAEDVTTMASTLQQLKETVAELKATAGSGRDGERRRSAEGKRRRGVPRVPRVREDDQAGSNAGGALASEGSPRSSVRAAGATDNEGVANNGGEMEAMATAIKDLATMVARLQPEPIRQPRRGRSHDGSSSRPNSSSGASDDGGNDSPSESSNEDSDDDAESDDDANDGPDSSDNDSSDSQDPSSSSSDSGSESEGHRGRRRRRGQRRRRGHHERHVQRERHERRKQSRKRSVKDLELPTYTPSPKVSVSTWIDRVDLALKGAAESGRGKWSDHALYFILGNKLMDNAARWWVNMNRRLPKRDRTWTNLKKALLRRYGEKLDKSAAEWRVNMRRMMPGKTYADFAAALRDVVGRNKVSERVLLAQFCRSLDKTTKKLVKQRPKPRTLEEAVDKANEIDDPMDNVALGMMNIGQPWATAPSPYLVPVDGTTGQTLVIPGIGGTGLSTELMAAGLNGTTTTDGDGGVVALFTNPRGVWNKYSGTWDVPSGRVWNGQFWYEPKKNARKRSPEDQQLRKPKDAKKPARTFKTRIEPTPSSSDESDVRPPKKRTKAAVRQTTEPRAESRTEQRMNSGQSTRRPAVQVSSGHPGCRRCGQLGHWMAQCPNGPKCYACNQLGHFAKDCTDEGARTRNQEYLKKRQEDKKTPENGKPTQ
ncbi:hypothetical protein F441_19409 [Phytophthora nicotianae CJ01A1]|uniref:CCHC-type domain-containing protein n=1 Tax=Phytophthora nicotianae CJ01A1 TaxID=1317063 RepID=W2VZD9_PHYNI|nr:hypothetical protein F441_19409 [Phytophthora nicotianae CJ01A1]